MLFQYAGGILDAALGFPYHAGGARGYTQEQQKTLALARIDEQLKSYP